jgi:hypothetical protein
VGDIKDESNSEFKVEPASTDLQDDLIKKNKLLEEEIERLNNERINRESSGISQRNTSNRLSFISDFVSAILSSLGSSHSALSVNFGGGVRGAFFAALYQSFFLIGLIAVSYGFYQITNMQEQRVFIPNEESNR